MEKEIKVLEKQKSKLGRDNIVRRGIRKVAVTLSKTAREKRTKKMLGDVEGRIAAEKKRLKGQGKESSRRLVKLESSRDKLSKVEHVSIWKRLSFGNTGREARSAFMESRELRREARQEFLAAVDSRLKAAKQSLGNNQELLTLK